MQTMNRHIILLTPLLLLAACSSSDSTSPDPNPAKTLSADVASLELGADKDLSKTFNISSTNTRWGISYNAPWLTLDKDAGRGSSPVTVTAGQNTSITNPRTAELVLSSKESMFNYKQSIFVNQQAATPYITPGETSLAFNGAENRRTVAITSNCEWEALCEDTWVSIEQGASELVVSVSSNIGDARTATISLRRKGETNVIAQIVVVQGEAGVTANLESVTFECTGGRQTIKIDAEAEWGLEKKFLASVEVTPTEGMAGINEIVITALQNYSLSDIDGFIYIKIGDKQKMEIPVHIEGVKYALSEKNLSIKHSTEAMFDETSTTFRFYSNTNWKVISSQDFLTVSPSRGKKNETVNIKVSATENDSENFRNGILYFKTNNGDGEYDITKAYVKQNGRLDANALYFPVSQSSQKIDLQYDLQHNLGSIGHWTAQTTCDWIHLSEMASGESTVTITVDDNSGQGTRQGKIVFSLTYEDRPMELWIVQEGTYSEISMDDVLTTPNACTLLLSMYSSTGLYVGSDVEWMNVYRSSYKPNNIIVLVDDNCSIKERHGKLDITSDDGVTVLSFTQPGLSLSTNKTSDIEMTAEGGELNSPVIVTADRKYKVYTPDSWITIKENKNTFNVSLEAWNGRTKRNGSIIIALEDMEEEQCSITIPVVQHPRHFNILIEDFDDNNIEDWNP